MTDINNAKYLITDLVAGDDSVFNREDYLRLNKEDILSAVNLIAESDVLSDKIKSTFLSNVWRIYYRTKPPTIEEFLTEEWIGPTARNIYPHVKDILYKFWEPDSTYRNLILANAIGSGKSTLSVLCSLYSAVHLWAMRSPHKFFNLSQSSSIVNMMVSFTEEKAKQLLVQPFFRILITSPKFQRIKQEEKLDQKQEEDFPDKICWTSAGKIGQMQFYNDIHYAIGSSPDKFLGLSLISAIISEISFFIEKGYSPDHIWRTYQDCKGRVKSRFFDRYFSYTILDSSPNDIDSSPIDKYIFDTGEVYRDPTNYVVTGPQWEFLGNLKGKYPVWQKTKETFPVFRGSSSEPARIISEEERNRYRNFEIYDVPIDLKSSFLDACTKSVKDFCGWPSGSQEKLIPSDSVIESMFVDQLKNFYSYIHVPIEKPSKDTLWNIVKDYFIDYGGGRYDFYRAPSEVRYGHIDQGEKKDHAGISFVHPELDENGEIVYVSDFTIDISPGKSKINLDAIRLFILDLKNRGGWYIGQLTFDQYQSSVTIDNLKDQGLKNVGRLSVDRDPAVYRLYINYLNRNKLKTGKNIILKNNLKSLIESKTPRGRTKIDHQKGKLVQEDLGGWKRSQIGMFSKDLSDSHCGAVWNASHYFKGVPKYTWIDQKIVERGGNSIDKNINIMKNRINSRLLNQYGLAIK